MSFFGRPPAAELPLHWKMAMPAPSSVAIMGTTPKRFTETLAAIWPAISRSRPTSRARWCRRSRCSIPSPAARSRRRAPAGLLGRQDQGGGVVLRLPFGPSTDEFMAWAYYGGGQALWREILAPHGIHSGVLPDPRRRKRPAGPRGDPARSTTSRASGCGSSGSAVGSCSNSVFRPRCCHQATSIPPWSVA